MGFVEEVAGQPAALRKLVEYYQDSGDELLYTAQRMSSRMPRSIIFTGMGSSDMASEIAVPYLADRSRAPVVRWEAGELLHYGLTTIRDHDVIVIVSQSGESVEAVRVAEALRYHQQVIAVTNDPNSTLTRHTRLTLPILAGDEGSIAGTTYTNSMAVLLLLSRVLAQEDWMPVFPKMLMCASSMEGLLAERRDEAERAADFLSEAEMVHFVARGPAMAAARWGALVLQEAARVPAAVMSGASMRHGPLEVIGPGAHAVLFASEDKGGDLVRRMAADMADLGCKVVLFSGADAVESERVMVIRIAPGDAETFSLVCEPVEALLLDRMARDRGCIPGEFIHGSKVTTRE